MSFLPSSYCGGKALKRSVHFVIAAAVVGVVLNLALVFGAAVIFPAGFTSTANLFAAAISIAAFVALYKFKAEVLWVVLAGGLIGLVKTVLFG